MALKSSEKSTAGRLSELTPNNPAHWDAAENYLSRIPEVRVDEDHDDYYAAVLGVKTLFKPNSTREKKYDIGKLSDKALDHISTEKQRMTGSPIHGHYQAA